MKRKVLALLCAAMLLVTGAQAEMTATTDMGAVYAGEDNLLTMEGVDIALTDVLAVKIVGAAGNQVYYLTLNGSLADETPVYALSVMDVQTKAVQQIEENVLFAAYQPGDDVVYYVVDGEKTQLSAWPDAQMGGAAKADIEKIQPTTMGLAVTVDGADKLYLPGIGMLSIAKQKQGAEYLMVDGVMDVLAMPDGTLLVQPVTSNETKLVAENVSAVSYDAVQGKLYYVKQAENGYVLCVYDAQANASSDVCALTEVSEEKFLVNDGVAYALAADNSLYAYTIETHISRQIDALASYALVKPSIEVAGDKLLVYDEIEGIRLFVAEISLADNAENSKPEEQPVVYTELKNGSRGEAVVNLQQRLIDLNYLDDEADGIYGPLTQAAVELLQYELGMEETGVADPDFQQYIYTHSIPALQLYAQLEKGDEGASVRKMQERLRDLFYMASSADGDFGSRTKTAVELYQAQNGFTVNGVATEAMLKHLYSGNAPKCADYIELRRYDSGTLVKNLNARLLELGYTTKAASYSYSSETEEAVKRAQAGMGMAQTGVASVEFQRKLFSQYASYNGGYVGSVVEMSYDARLRLCQLGYLAIENIGSGTIKDFYSAAVYQAIRDFQNEAGLIVSGVLTDETFQALYSDNAPHAPVFMSNIELSSVLSQMNAKYAQKKSEIELMELIQQRLIQLGYMFNGYVPNGVYNRATYAAVAYFQRDNSLVSSTEGILDVQTIYALMGW